MAKELESKSGITFELHETPSDGNCGYHAIGVSREEAYELLHTNAKNVRQVLAPVIEAELLTDQFIQYYLQRNPGAMTLRNDFISYQRASATGASVNQATQTLFKHAQDENIIRAYLTYDIIEKRTAQGWAHVNILQAIAHLKGFGLYIWEPNGSGCVQPHSTHHSYALPGAHTRRDLLFRSGNHFDALRAKTWVSAIHSYLVMPGKLAYNVFNAPSRAIELGGKMFAVPAARALLGDGPAQAVDYGLKAAAAYANPPGFVLQKAGQFVAEHTSKFLQSQFDTTSNPELHEGIGLLLSEAADIGTSYLEAPVKVQLQRIAQPTPKLITHTRHFIPAPTQITKSISPASVSQTKTFSMIEQFEQTRKPSKLLEGFKPGVPRPKVPTPAKVSEDNKSVKILDVFKQSEHSSTAAKPSKILAGFRPRVSRPKPTSGSKDNHSFNILDTFKRSNPTRTPRPPIPVPPSAIETRSRKRSIESTGTEIETVTAKNPRTTVASPAPASTEGSIATRTRAYRPRVKNDNPSSEQRPTTQLPKILGSKRVLTKTEGEIIPTQLEKKPNQDKKDPAIQNGVATQTPPEQTATSSIPTPKTQTPNVAAPTVTSNVIPNPKPLVAETVILEAQNEADRIGQHGNKFVIANQTALALAKNYWGDNLTPDQQAQLAVMEGQIFTQLDKKDGFDKCIAEVGRIILEKESTAYMPNLITQYSNNQPLDATSQSLLKSLDRNHNIASAFVEFTNKSIQDLGGTSMTTETKNQLHTQCIAILDGPTSKQEDAFVKAAVPYMQQSLPQQTAENLLEASYRNEQQSHSLAQGEWHNTPASYQLGAEQRIHNHSTNVGNSVIDVGKTILGGGNGTGVGVTTDGTTATATVGSAKNPYAIPVHTLTLSTPHINHHNDGASVEETFTPNPLPTLSGGAEQVGKFNEALEQTTTGNVYKATGIAINAMNNYNDAQHKNSDNPLLSTVIRTDIDLLIGTIPVVNEVVAVSTAWKNLVPPAPLPSQPTQAQLQNESLIEMIMRHDIQEAEHDRLLGDTILRLPADIVDGIKDGVDVTLPTPSAPISQAQLSLNLGFFNQNSVIGQTNADGMCLDPRSPS